MTIEHAPITKVEMLIRKPVSEVFEAFVDPAVTTRFWFTKSSGKLETGKKIEWSWEMYGVSTQLLVKAMETNRRILIEWSGYSGPTDVEWRFTSQRDGTTFVSITESGFTGSDDELMKQVADSTQGFALVIAGLKALLEHDIQLNLVADHRPDSIKSN